MRENIIFAILGVVLGFFVGFFIANAINVKPVGPTSASTEAVDSEAQLPPGHPDVANSGGSAAATSAQAQEAMDQADRNPKDFSAQLKAAAIFYDLSSFDKAKLYLEKALALKPDDPDALVGLAHTKFESNDFVGAAMLYEKLLQKTPDDLELRVNLGNTFVRRSPPNYERAIAEFRQVLAIDSRNEGAFESLANAAIRTGDKAAAREAIDKLAVVNPSNPALESLRARLSSK